MRVQIYLIAALLSAILWLMSFDETRDVYRGAQRAGILPNLHIGLRIDRVI